MNALTILTRHREELVDLLADERPALQLVGGRRYVAELLVALARAEAHEEWHAEGQVPELVPASNAEVERFVRAVKDGAHAAAEEYEPNRLRAFVQELGEFRGDAGDDAIRIIQWQRAAREAWESRALQAEAALSDVPGVKVCARCGRELVFSSRQRGDGLCGVCSRAANGTSTEADRVHLAIDAARELPEVIPAGATVIDEATTEHVRQAMSAPAKALASDGRAHDEQVKHGPSAGAVPVVCAWRKAPTCDGHVRGPKPTGDPQEFVSHGMCVPCFTVVSHEQAKGRAS